MEAFVKQLYNVIVNLVMPIKDAGQDMAHTIPMILSGP